MVSFQEYPTADARINICSDWLAVKEAGLLLGCSTCEQVRRTIRFFHVQRSSNVFKSSRNHRYNYHSSLIRKNVCSNTR